MQSQQFKTITSLTKTKFQQIFKNPSVDILYEKTRQDILSDLSYELRQPIEKLYKYLEIEEKEWQKKLNDRSLITTREIFKLAGAAGLTIEIGRPTNRCDFYEPLNDPEKFEELFTETIKNLLKKIDKESTEKNKKGLLTRCCGSSIMNSIKDDESIKRTYSLDSSFEALNQCLYAFSYCFEFTPQKQDKSMDDKLTQEAMAEQAIETLKLVPYSETEKEKTIKETLKAFIKSEDPSILQLILNTKDKIKEQKLEQITPEQLIFMMAINNINSTDNDEYSTLSGPETLKSSYTRIAEKINRVPNYEDTTKILAKKLNIPECYITSQPGQIPECNTAEYLLKMSYVTNTPLRFSADYVKETKLKYLEEKDTAYSIQEEKNKKAPLQQEPKKAKTVKQIQEEETSAVEEDDKNQKEGEKMPISYKSTELIEQIRSAAENERPLLPILLPLIRAYFDIDLNETFLINETAYKIKAKAGIEDLYTDNNRKAEISKHIEAVAELASGTLKSFRFAPFEPQNGDEYWTFNVPEEFVPVKRIWGSNPVADKISKMFNIIYKKEKEIRRIEPETVKKQILG